MPCPTISCWIRQRNHVTSSDRCLTSYHVLCKIQRNGQHLMLLCQSSTMTSQGTSERQASELGLLAASNLFLDNRPWRVSYLSRRIWPSHVLHKKQQNGNSWCYFAKRKKCNTRQASTSAMQGTRKWQASGLGWLIMFDLYLSHRAQRVPTLVAKHGIPNLCHTWVLFVMSKNAMMNKAQQPGTIPEEFVSYLSVISHV